jgi:hypothetical protein
MVNHSLAAVLTLVMLTVPTMLSLRRVHAPTRRRWRRFGLSDHPVTLEGLAGIGSLQDAVEPEQGKQRREHGKEGGHRGEQGSDLGRLFLEDYA